MVVAENGKQIRSFPHSPVSSLGGEGRDDRIISWMIESVLPPKYERDKGTATRTNMEAALLMYFLTLPTDALCENLSKIRIRKKELSREWYLYVRELVI